MGVPQSTQIPNSPLSSLVTASAMSCSRARDWSSRVAAWERSKARVAPSGSCSSSLLSPSRSEERRVGKECRPRGSPAHEKKNEKASPQDRALTLARREDDDAAEEDPRTHGQC